MFETKTTGQKLRQFIYILFPIVITQVGLYSMNFFDTLMSGQASPEDLAGVAIGSSLWVPVFTGLSGVLMALTPIVSQLVGANQKGKVPFSVLQALYLSFFLTIVVMTVGFVILSPILDGMNLNQKVETVAFHYLAGLSFGMLPLFMYTVLRCFIDALGATRTTMVITLLSLPINVLFNYVLIFGKFGFPKLGGIGAGYASAITYWFILIVAILVVIRHEPFSLYRIFRKWYPISFSAWKELLIIGVPIGFAIFFEVSIFAAVTLLMSQFNTTTIAAHQAAINFASMLYMVPLSISMALTIAVGFEVGAKRYKDAKQYSTLGILIAILISLLSTAILILFNETIAGIYTNDQHVLELLSHFLLYAIFFQLSDAVAAPIQGALRGYKDVNITLIMALISYWVVGLPLGYILAKYSSFGPFGYWIGLSSGLLCGAITLYVRLRHLQLKFQSRTPGHHIPTS
ncbi:MATE family efflux transporter [Alkalihalobacillus sp. AL-G]|uniref:MATE family efflux transporter n=1 Tax=Alkalihalobacillus sp. AL-G TaxID=2926399 RepID=UPI00272C1030|nr:MATE family efflux transporter [Alkalihalobacillus sp. AL-G]WLD91574.1 MATE family efflux transporter [Alkalihalobacillus sp. AL-G]